MSAPDLAAPDLSAPDLSALVAARLCHDLISPLGAIRNGLELMQMAPAAAGEAEVELVSDSLETALAKLRYYRLAFGPADPRSHQSCGEVAQAAEAMFQGRFTVAWQSRGLDMPRPRARVICLVLLCLEKSLPTGGLVRITDAGEATGFGTTGFSVEGRRTAPPAELWAHVMQGTPPGELRADAVQFALLRRALAETGHRLSAAFTDSSADLRLTEVTTQPA